MKANKKITYICMLISIIFFAILIYLYIFKQSDVGKFEFLKNLCWSLFGSSFITAITTDIICKNEFRERETQLFLKLISIFKNYMKFINNNYLPNTEVESVENCRKEYFDSCKEYFEELEYLHFYLGIDKSRFSGLYNILGALHELNQDVGMICTYKKCNETNKEKVIEYYERCKNDIKIIEESISIYSKNKYSILFQNEIKYRDEPIKKC